MDEYSINTSNALILVPNMDSNLEIEIPFPFGKHFIKINQFQGQLTFDSQNSQLTSGCISLKIEDFHANDPTLLCHFLEAMTLDYSVSDYPRKHVGINTKLPISGINAPKYNSISATLNKPTNLMDFSINLKWIIRGIEKNLDMPMLFSWDNIQKKLHIKADWKMNRSDFGIVVKKFLFIETENTLKLSLNLVLQADSRSA